MPRTVSALFVIPVPGTKVTVADVSSRSAGFPAFASAAENAIEKQAACAAAISSSGDVLPCASSARFAQSTSSEESTPLVTLSIVPPPSIKPPCHVTDAVRSVAMCLQFCVDGHLDIRVLEQAGERAPRVR